MVVRQSTAGDHGVQEGGGSFVDVGDVQVVEHGLPFFLVPLFASIHKNMHQVQVLVLLQMASLLFGVNYFSC